MEETLQFVQTLQSPIRKVAGGCGRAARTRDTRIPVWTLVAYRNQGATDLDFLIQMIYQLRLLGYGIWTCYEVGQANQKISDDQLLNYATNLGRIILTENR